MDYWQKVSIGIVGALVLVMGAFSVGYSLARRSAEATPTIDSNEKDAALRIIRDAYEEIRGSAVEQPGEEELARGAVKGMVNVLKKTQDDPYALFYSPQAYRSFQELTTGRFSGIGVWLKDVKGALQIVSVLPDSPALGAGLETGDTIEEIDGRPVDRMSSDEAVARIKGPEGTEVELLVERSGDELDFTITRKEIDLPSVRASLQGGDIGYVQLVTFANGAGDAVRDEVERLSGEGAEGIILDMRDNGGGLFDEAIDVASVFIEDGEVVSYESRTEPDVTYEAEGDAIEDIPLVVLVNGGTASASEIVTGALQDRDRAIVVGTTTYGKGSVQRLIPLLDGSALKLTTAAYLTPEGGSIDGDGIEPDIRVEDGRQVQKRRAFEVLRGMLVSGTDSGG
ncbi:MAG TPA: S41 family peptidase [Actinomycetota bacterium]|nr:S41 family peptidase [Actinomycetota bacterium]